MKQWYRRTLTKVILLLVGVISGAAFITSLGVAATYAGTIDPSQITSLINEPYEDSPDFNSAVEGAMYEAFGMFRVKNLMETDGAYDPGKEIDIMAYADPGQGGSIENGKLMYRLDHLISWSEDYNSTGEDLYDENVIVCRNVDGTYYYYYFDDFLALFESGQLMAEFDDEYHTQAQFLNDLSNKTAEEGYNGSVSIVDSDGKEIYTDCWNFGSALEEEYAPVGGKNLLEVVNNTPELNGNLTEIYDRLSFVLSGIFDDYTTYQSGWDYLEEGNTNFTYLYVDKEKKQVFTNRADYADYADVGKHIEEMKSGDSVKYVIVNPRLKDFETNMNLSASSEWDTVRSYESNRNSENILAISVDTSYPIQDQFYEGSENYNQNIPFLRWALILFIAGGILFIISAVWLAVTAGKKPGSEDLHLTVFDHWKTEISAGLVIGLWVLVTCVMIGTVTTFSSFPEVSTAVEYYGADTVPVVYSTLFTAAINLADLAGLFFYGLFTFLCFFAGYVSLIRRIKAKILWKGSLLCALITAAGRVWKSRAITMKSAAAVLGFMFIQWLAIIFRDVPFLVLAVAVDVAVIWAVMCGAVAKSRIRKGIEEISGGNLEYRIDLKWLRGEERDIAEKINNIGSGLNKAVDEAMRNERLKTDLITNVSHDIKTPLTSIINYVDILKRSNIDDEKIRGYLDILEAKAQRLKTLTEDVVEASKVSSGNITLEYMDMDLRELVQQTEGEMAEKFAARNLTMVLNLPEKPAVIHVDGRRMWRVLENIFGNAAKYAMPGTRVYADLILTEDKVNFSLKNVSEQQLNISADELTERFIRGDISRSTEGSGLGLSIAKSLTTMQGGKFELYLDGDLFRVNIQFERVYSRTA